MPIGLSAFSFPWHCGYAGRGTPRGCSSPYDAYGLMHVAAQHQLGGVEVPLAMLPDLEPATLAAYRVQAESHGMQLVADSGIVDVPTLEQYIPAAAAIGAPVLRVMLSGILEGARATIPGGWEAHLNEMIARLRLLRPVAEHYGVILAPENHQDATSEDLLRVCEEVGGNAIGVTLDAVNPLAVGEDPLSFARALGSRIVNVHLKDYHIHLTPSGYRLVRCAIGDGVLDVPGLFALLDEVAPHTHYNIELAALHARHIRLLEDDWWNGYGPYDARTLVPALRLAYRHARPADEDWRSPWEREAPPDEMAAYEDDQLERSVAYLRSLRSTV